MWLPVQIDDGADWLAVTNAENIIRPKKGGGGSFLYYSRVDLL